MASIAPLQGALNQKQVAHLLRRSTFGPTKGDIDSCIGKSIQQILDNLFEDRAESPAPPIDLATSQTWVNGPRTALNNEEFQLFNFLLGWWLKQMLNDGLKIKEKLTFFLHTHFTTSQSIVGTSAVLYHQNTLFRQYALGDYKELSRKICRDNAMTMYLDNDQNVMGSPNENFARELLELYTIGKGPVAAEGDYTTFTELDVREAARVLSGYSRNRDYDHIDTETGLPTAFLRSNGFNQAIQHDAGSKTFSARFQNRQIVPNEIVQGLATVDAGQQELQDLIDMIFDQEATALHFCRKLYRFFVYYRISDEIENDIIAPMAATFRSSNFQVEPVLRQLLSSQHFFNADNSITTDNVSGSMIKSPLEIAMNALRFFETSFPDSETNLEAFYESTTVFRYALEQQGLPLYQPFEVAGYTAYHQAPSYNRNWISSNSLAQRYSFAGALVWGGWIPDVKIDVIPWVENEINDPRDAQEIVTVLLASLLPESLTIERRDYFLNSILLDGLSLGNWSMEWGNYESTGDDTGVRGQLETLLAAIFQSPEYQLL